MLTLQEYRVWALLPVKLHAVGRTSPEAHLDWHLYHVSAMHTACSPGEKHRDAVEHLPPRQHLDTYCLPCQRYACRTQSWRDASFCRKAAPGTHSPGRSLKASRTHDPIITRLLFIRHTCKCKVSTKSLAAMSSKQTCTCRCQAALRQKNQYFNDRQSAQVSLHHINQLSSVGIPYP